MATSQETQEKISVRNLYKVFGARPDEAIRHAKKGAKRGDIQKDLETLLALRDITFSVAEGEIFMLMGLSGSGKSTLLRCINRLHEPTRGDIEVAGKDMLALSRDELRDMRRTTFGMVFQHFGLLPNRTVLENVTFGLELRGVSREERNERGIRVIKQVGLAGWEHKMTSELSGGMQQRVGLARALAVDPEILLMDEPFSALDPLIRTELQQELLKLHRDMKRTILFVTHDLNEAIRVGDRIAILDSEGTLVQVGTAEEILLAPASDYVEQFLSDIDRPAVIRVKSIMERDTTSHTREGPIQSAAVLKDILPRLLHARDALPVHDKDGNRVGLLRLERAVEILKTKLS